MNLFCKQCLAALPILAAAFTTSCSDQDFDWDKAHGQNVETNYEQRFDNLFGAIDPDQNWDFSSKPSERISSFTLSDGTEVNIGTVGASTRAGESGDDDSFTTAAIIPASGWYNIPSQSLTWFRNKFTDGVNHTSLGNEFAMYVPGGECTVTPFFQGAAGDTWDLYMYFSVPDDTGFNSEPKRVKVWGKGDNMQQRVYKVTLNSTNYLIKENQNGTITLIGAGNFWGAKYTSNAAGTSVSIGNKTYNYTKSGTTYTFTRNGNTIPSALSEWEDVSTIGHTEAAVELRSKTYHFTNIPDNTIVWFGLYDKSYKRDGETEQYEALSIEDQMRAVTLDPGYEPAANEYPIDFGQFNHPIVMGCEDRPIDEFYTNNDGTPQLDENGNIKYKSDKDYNDAVFFVNGLEPYDIVHKRKYVTYEKRYMVEDMGYSDKNSQAVTNGYTDIDFNDIVIDFHKKTLVDETWMSVGDGEENWVATKTTIEESWAKIMALGGTWDFQLYVGDNLVFQKSAAATYLNFNDNYKVGNTKISEAGIAVKTMYNTGFGSDRNGDGNPKTTVGIGTLKNDVQNWDPTTNNIRFLIVDNEGPDFSKWNVDQYFDSNNEKPGNVYTITWPKMGAHPKIAAFPTTTMWQTEREAVSKGFFSTAEVRPVETPITE